jgi:hypothetical protein
MGDSTYPIGKNFPAGSYGTYPARTSKMQGSAQTASFQSLLNQKQSANSFPTSTIAQTPASMSNALPPQFQAETKELLANMPHRMQPGESFQDKILESQREYQSMKAAKSEPQQAAPQQIASSPAAGFNSALGASFSSVPIQSTPMPTTQAYSQPAQSQLEPVIDNTPNANPLLSTKPATTNRIMWSDDAVTTTSAKNTTQTQTSASTENKSVGESFFGFFKNIASFATLGFYRPDNEPAPTGIGRVGYPFKKLLWDAPKSLIVDTPTSIANSVTNSMNAKQPNEPQLAQSTETSSRSSRRFASSKPWMHARV